MVIWLGEARRKLLSRLEPVSMMKLKVGLSAY